MIIHLFVFTLFTCFCLCHVSYHSPRPPAAQLGHVPPACAAMTSPACRHDVIQATASDVTASSARGGGGAAAGAGEPRGEAAPPGGSSRGRSSEEVGEGLLNLKFKCMDYASGMERFAAILLPNVETWTWNWGFCKTTMVLMFWPIKSICLILFHLQRRFITRKWLSIRTIMFCN